MQQQTKTDLERSGDELEERLGRLDEVAGDWEDDDDTGEEDAAGFDDPEDLDDEDLDDDEE